MKRQRGRGNRKPGGHHQPNRTLESSGPEIKVRGPAAHIYERYLNLARDASSSGDRVMAENYLQHAEHYFRVLRATQPTMPPPQQQHQQHNGDRFSGGDLEYEGDEEGGEEGAEQEASSSDAPDQPDVEFPGAQQQQQQQHQQQHPQGGGGQNFERDGDFRRRRGRRNRFRPNGEGEAPREGGESQASPAPERQPERAQERPPERPQASRERAPREPREGGDQGGEGFSDGPKPAFLRGE